MRCEKLARLVAPHAFGKRSFAPVKFHDLCPGYTAGMIKNPPCLANQAMIAPNNHPK
jgi:hypothetical protein